MADELVADLTLALGMCTRICIHMRNETQTRTSVNIVHAKAGCRFNSAPQPMVIDARTHARTHTHTQWCTDMRKHEHVSLSFNGSIAFTCELCILFAQAYARPHKQKPPCVLMWRACAGLNFGGYFPTGEIKGEIETFVSKKGHLTDWHFDFQENFTIQLSGTKRWKVMRSGITHPIRGWYLQNSYSIYYYYYFLPFDCFLFLFFFLCFCFVMFVLFLFLFLLLYVAPVIPLRITKQAMWSSSSWRCMRCSGPTSSGNLLTSPVCLCSPNTHTHTAHARFYCSLLFVICFVVSWFCFVFLFVFFFCFFFCFFGFVFFFKSIYYLPFFLLFFY